MKKIDYHIHGEFSTDSAITFEELIWKAIKTGYSEIAITEHFDLIPSEVNFYGVPPYEEYYKTIHRLKEKYNDTILILFGVELGELHRIREYAEAILKYHQPDLKIGAIHILSDGKNISIPFAPLLSQQQIKDYYLENLKLVTSTEIDILGHLGIYKRFLTETPDERFVSEIIDEIFARMLEKNIALEVNYSPFRKPYNQMLPEPQYIRRYLDLGGELLTIGSDSHSLDDFDDHYEKTIDTLKEIGVRNIVKKTMDSWEKMNI